MFGPQHRVSRLARLLTLGVMVALAPAVRAGVNVWTGAGTGEHLGNTGVATHVVTDPQDPDVVYAVFQPAVFRSGDGGRSWTRIGWFGDVQALFVHPTISGTLLVGAEGDIYKTSDDGAHWSWREYPGGVYPIVAFASSADGATIYAGEMWGHIFKSTDDGDTWVEGAKIEGIIASLVVNPRTPENVFFGTEADYYYPYAFMARSSDAGDTFQSVLPGETGTVTAIAIDPDASATVYAALTSSRPNDLKGIFRSEDGGETWSSFSFGIPGDAEVTSLALDPHTPSTLYAGTSSGIYRTRDAGGIWTTVGQGLSHSSIESLSLSSDGRSLRAGADQRVFDLELASGAVDVTAVGSGGTGVLSWSDDRLTLLTMDASGAWSSGPAESPSASWLASAIANGGDGVTRLLWQSGDGRSAFEARTTAGAAAVAVSARQGDWMPADVSAGSGGHSQVLWTSAKGGMYVAAVDASGHASPGHEYPPNRGWSAVAISEDASGAAWVLWRSADGRSCISVHRDDGAIEQVLKYEAAEGWTVEDLAFAADGRARILASHAGGAMQVWIADSNGHRNVGGDYDNAGFAARRIAAGTDGRTRVLWTDREGRGSVWILDAGGTVLSRNDIPAGP